MNPKKTRWGLFPFLGSFVFIGLSIFLSLHYQPQFNTYFYCSVLPFIGIVFSALSFFIGHFSYPRVHNLKVYLIGYLAGLTGLGYFLLYRFPGMIQHSQAPEGFLFALYILIFINVLSVLFAPSFVKYRTAKHIVLAVVPVECVVLFIFRFSPHATVWARALTFQGLLDPSFYLGTLFFLLTASISIWRVQDEFYLGGILAGSALLYCVSWTSRMYFSPLDPIELLLFAGAPLYLEAGILVHWFIRMEHRIAYDPLLHIYNRDYCSKIISEQSKLNLMFPLSIAMVDIDHFKNVNDTHGHQAGDQVLYTVAQTVCKEVVPNGVVCRYGGEELIIFFPQQTAKQVTPLVEKMRKTIEKTSTKTTKKTIRVTVSCGISCREEPGQSIMDVIHAADKALYKAKESGRNQVKMGKTAASAPPKKK
ncbi:MAG: GGDEF domain-containing protein [Chitinivibrionales bacterium]